MASATENGNTQEQQPEEGTQHVSAGVQWLAFSGLFLAGITLAVSFIPCVGALAVAPGVLALLLSGWAMVLAHRRKTYSAVSVAALMLSLIGFFIAVAWGVIVLTLTAERQQPGDVNPFPALDSMPAQNDTLKP